MKNLIVITLLFFPFFVMAQSNVKNNDSRKQTAFVYISMEYKSEATTVKSPKKSRDGVRTSDLKKTNYIFNTNNERLQIQLTKMSTSFKNEISALNALGKMGWELIDIDNGKYYFMSKRGR
jgi:hypothetical protein